MLIKNTLLLEKLLVKPKLLSDNRGWFYRQLDSRDLSAILQEELNVVNINRSFNIKRGTLRGMHLQCQPMAEVKVVSCIKGSIQDVIVDLNPSSSTYLNYVSCILNPDDRYQLIVPKGFAHGYLTLEDSTEVQYITTNYYSLEHELVYNGLSSGLNDVWVSIPKYRSEKDTNAIDII
jgi:dTDP-4-dehydrorhamnose 3,5-epimerase